MDNKLLRSQNFQKKVTIDESQRQKAIKQIKLSEKDNKIIDDYVDANNKIGQLEKIDQLTLKKEKIDPFIKKAVKNYKRHLRILKHGWKSYDKKNSYIEDKHKDAKKIDFSF